MMVMMKMMMVRVGHRCATTHSAGLRPHSQLTPMVYSPCRWGPNMMTLVVMNVNLIFWGAPASVPALAFVSGGNRLWRVEVPHHHHSHHYHHHHHHHHYHHHKQFQHHHTRYHLDSHCYHNFDAHQNFDDHQIFHEQVEPDKHHDQSVASLPRWVGRLASQVIQPIRSRTQELERVFGVFLFSLFILIKIIMIRLSVGRTGTALPILPSPRLLLCPRRCPGEQTPPPDQDQMMISVFL